MRAVLLLACFMAEASFCPGQSLGLNDFPGLAKAPIYVIEGNFDYRGTTNGLTVDLQCSSSMDPATGALQGSGDFTIQGSFNSFAIDWLGTIGVDMNVKTAGSAVRVNGKLNMNGSGTVAGVTLEKLSLIYRFTNFDVEAATGEMAGYVSLKGSARLLGENVPLSLPKTHLSLDLPDFDEDGQWDSTGQWRISDISATVDGKGKIKGTGKFAALDEAGNPYDIPLEQKITGTVQNDVVTLDAVGSSKSTSKVKARLVYRQSDGQMFPKKNSVTAYGQSRTF